MVLHLLKARGSEESPGLSQVPKEVETVNQAKRYHNHEKRLIGAQATGTEFLAACYVRIISSAFRL